MAVTSRAGPRRGGSACGDGILDGRRLRLSRVVPAMRSVTSNDITARTTNEPSPRAIQIAADEAGPARLLPDPHLNSERPRRRLADRVHQQRRYKKGNQVKQQGRPG